MSRALLKLVWTLFVVACSAYFVVYGWLILVSVCDVPNARTVASTSFIAFGAFMLHELGRKK